MFKKILTSILIALSIIFNFSVANATLVDIGGGSFFPRAPISAATSPNFGNILVDAVGEKAAYIFEVPKTGNIDKIGFRTTTVTTGATFDVRLETVATSTGEPSGTLVGTNTNITQAIANTDDNVWFEVTLTSAASVTKGDIVAVVIASPGAGSFSANFASYADDGAIGFPATMQYTTSWAYVSTGAPVMSVRYDDSTYPPISGIFPLSNLNSHTYNSGSTPDVYANKMNLPFSAEISGAWVWADLDGDAVINLYDSDGVTVLASTTMYTNIPKLSSQSINIYKFNTPVEITANTNYWIGVEPSSGTSLIMYTYQASTASILGQMPLASNFVHSSAKNPSGTGSWTDDSTQMLTLGAIISKVDDGTGTGGGGSVETSRSFMQ